MITLYLVIMITLHLVYIEMETAKLMRLTVLKDNWQFGCIVDEFLLREKNSCCGIFSKFAYFSGELELHFS